MDTYKKNVTQLFKTKCRNSESVLGSNSTVSNTQKIFLFSSFNLIIFALISKRFDFLNLVSIHDNTKL